MSGKRGSPVTSHIDLPDIVELNIARQFVTRIGHHTIPAVIIINVSGSNGHMMCNHRCSPADVAIDGDTLGRAA